ncbi:MAG: type II toxin-antitoxin system RelE/ParE family toxin [Elusimicrobia bacterium]|nr:type II toxin-antitoxin system RelE/ParE family toxin [Elusimicrobiota bacterium]
MSLFEILVRPEAEGDLRRLGKGEQKQILRAIRERLGTSPTQYGKLLGGTLKGLRRVRVGDYRIAYQAEKDRVVIWAVLHRKEIYLELAKRFFKGRKE